MATAAGAWQSGQLPGCRGWARYESWWSAGRARVPGGLVRGGLGRMADSPRPVAAIKARACHDSPSLRGRPGPSAEPPGKSVRNALPQAPVVRRESQRPTDGPSLSRRLKNRSTPRTRNGSPVAGVRRRLGTGSVPTSGSRCRAEGPAAVLWSESSLAGFLPPSGGTPSCQRLVAPTAARPNFWPAGAPGRLRPRQTRRVCGRMRCKPAAPRTRQNFFPRHPGGSGGCTSLMRRPSSAQRR
jgi:hypothetical protein